MTHIAILGPGAIGCTTAAWLMQNAAHRVMVLARSPLPGIKLKAPGRVLDVSPDVVTSPPLAPTPDWVLVTTKAYDAASASVWLQALTAGPTTVAILQNGVEHIERFEAFFPRERLLPVMVDIPAERTAPGRVTQHRNGCMVVPAGALGERFQQLFAGTAIEVKQAADFQSEVWRKLCLNAAGAISAVVMKPAGIALQDGIARLMAGIVRECIAVGRAEGARLDDGLVQAIIDGCRARPDGINSMHADRLAGRPMEIDARNGVIVRLGRKHRIATPVNECMVALLEAAAP